MDLKCNKSISIVTPIYKDHYLVANFVSEIKKIDSLIIGEIIFVLDGGEEDELFFEKFSENEPLVKCVYFSRNFGQHIAISAGYEKATGDLICLLNVDQQDSPSDFPKVVEQMLLQKLDIVYGLRDHRKDGWFKSVSSKGFNWLMNKLTGDNIPLNVTTLRVMSRKFIEHYNLLNEKSRYLPGLENWLGFKKGYVSIAHNERTEGKSSYTFSKRINLAINSIISFSDLPLKWTAYMGIIMSFLGFISLLVLMVLKLYLIDFKPGYISTIALILFIGGIQVMVIGLASLYIGRILKEVQARPLYIIKKKINF